eukprot:4942177-Alexandrium_andersonii.AAC.1
MRMTTTAAVASARVVSPRLMCVTCQFYEDKISFVSLHAPFDHEQIATRDQFWADLDTMVAELRQHSTVVVAGD